MKRHTREKFFQSKGGCCFVCKSTTNLTVDHILPQALGGVSHPANFLVLCRECNGKKSDMDPDVWARTLEIKELHEWIQKARVARESMLWFAKPLTHKGLATAMARKLYDRNPT